MDSDRPAGTNSSESTPANTTNRATEPLANEPANAAAGDSSAFDSPDAAADFDGVADATAGESANATAGESSDATASESSAFQIPDAASNSSSNDDEQ